ncbi:MAG: hypothetical protein AB1797_07860 [bacterium]
MMPAMLDLSSLPKEARTELIDFYQFIKLRYQKIDKKPKKRDISRLIPRTVPSFKPLKRDEIYDR